MLELLFAFDPVVLTAFIAAGLLLNITPGVDFVFITACGIAGGPRSGMAAALGINLGVALYVLAGAAGVSAVLLAYPASFDAIRYLGAAYLIFLAWQAWRSDGSLEKAKPALSAGAAVWRGFVTNILNPKTALFIFAFIPQFTDPAIGPVWQQILLLGAIFQIFGMVFSLSLGAATGLFADAIRTRVRILNKITAILFGGLAARLVFD